MTSMFKYPKMFAHTRTRWLSFAAVLFAQSLLVLEGADDASQPDRLNFGEYLGEPGFLKLFSGKDLTGWDGQPEL